MMVLFYTGISSVYAQQNKSDSLLNLIKLNPADDDVKARLLFELSTQSLYTDPKKGLTYLNQIIAIQNKIKFKPIVASSYRLKGIIQYLLVMYPDALTSLQEALRIDKLIKNPVGMAGDNANIGGVYLAQSNLPQALSYYLQPKNCTVVQKAARVMRQLYIPI
jgi:tetratricopeptide (TPR) repeat protein